MCDQQKRNSKLYETGQSFLVKCDLDLAGISYFDSDISIYCFTRLGFQMSALLDFGSCPQCDLHAWEALAPYACGGFCLIYPAFNHQDLCMVLPIYIDINKCIMRLQPFKAPWTTTFSLEAPAFNYIKVCAWCCLYIYI